MLNANARMKPQPQRAAHSVTPLREQCDNVFQEAAGRLGLARSLIDSRSISKYTPLPNPAPATAKDMNRNHP